MQEKNGCAVHCSTTEQEAVATWLLRQTQLKGVKDLALVRTIKINLAKTPVDFAESARSLPLPVLQLSAGQLPMNRRRDNHGDADNHRTDQYCQGYVLILLDFFASRERRDLHDDQKRQRE